MCNILHNVQKCDILHAVGDIMFNFSAFLVYMIITAITPGPNNITSMTNAARYGFKKSWPYNLGMWVAFTIVMILCALFAVLLSTVGITSTVLWALLGSKLRTLFSKHTKIVNGILALLLVWCTITLFQQ